MYFEPYTQSWMTWKVLVASAVSSGRSPNNCAGLAMNFCEELRDNLGALPGSTLTLISPPIISGSSVFAGELGDFVDMAEVSDGEDLALTVDVEGDAAPEGGVVGLLSFIVFVLEAWWTTSSSEGLPDLMFISSSEVSTPSGFTEESVPAMLVDSE